MKPLAYVQTSCIAAIYIIFLSWCTLLPNVCTSASKTQCANKLTDTVWIVPLKLGWCMFLLDLRKKDFSKSPINQYFTNSMLMTLLKFSSPDQRVNASSIQSTNSTRRWHSLTNLKITTAFQFLMSSLRGQISAYRPPSIINQRLLARTHVRVHSALAEAKLI